MNKKELRKKYLHMRSSIPKSEIIEKSHTIIQKLVKTDYYRHANVIMTYVDFKNEVVTRDFMQVALDDGQRIVVPVTDTASRKLYLSEIKDIRHELGPGTYGVLEPKKEFIREVSIDELDLILVPGLVYDMRGYRIGYGGGYYDRLLRNINKKTKTIGLAFDFQLVPMLVVESHDQKVDIIITEKRIIHDEHQR